MAENDQSEFAVLALPLLRQLYNLAHWLSRDSHEAEDLVQETYARALKGFSGFRPGTNFRAWMFVILRNLFYNEARRPWARHASLQEAPKHEPSIQSTQQQHLEFCDFRRAFSQLHGDQREMLILVGIGGLSYLEVGIKCGCPVGTVKSRVSRARHQLKTLMSGDALPVGRRMVKPVADLDPIDVIDGSQALWSSMIGVRLN